MSELDNKQATFHHQRNAERRVGLPKNWGELRWQWRLYLLTWDNEEKWRDLASYGDKPLLVWIRSAWLCAIHFRVWMGGLLPQYLTKAILFANEVWVHREHTNFNTRTIYKKDKLHIYILKILASSYFQKGRKGSFPLFFGNTGYWTKDLQSPGL